jgi:hypothetical protein
MILIPPDTRDLLDTTHGTQPTYEVDIQWASDGPFFTYTSEAKSGSRGLIISLSDVDSAIRVDRSGTSTSVSVVINDSDGNVKTVIDQNDPQTKVARIYLSFSNSDERQLLYSGSLSSPIVWNEGDRSVKFDIVELIKGQKFSIVSDDFVSSSLTPKAASEPWPVGFGTVRRAKALDLESGAYGTLDEDIYIRDPWAEVAHKAYSDNNVFVPSDASYCLGNQSLGNFVCVNYLGQNIFEAQGVPYVPERRKAWNQIRPMKIKEFRDRMTSQGALQKSKFKVVGFERFDLNKTITISLGDGARATGIMKSDGFFYVSSYFHKDKAKSNSYKVAANAYKEMPSSSYALPPKQWTLSGSGFGLTVHPQVAATYAKPGAIGKVLLAEDLEEIPKAEPQQFKRGLKISQIDATAPKSIYIVNIINSTIHKVEAQVKTESKDIQLSEVPTSWYTARTTTVGPFNVTELAFNRLPSSYDDEWLDEVFVTYTSSVGPKPTQCIRWVVENFTEYTVDEESFATIESQIGDEFHTVVPVGVTAVDAIRDLAYQCRCAAFVLNGKLILKYLGKEVSSVDTFTESDVLAGTLTIEHSNTEDIVTDLTATWIEDYSQEEGLQLRVRNNVAKYGVQVDSKDFWGFTLRPPIERSASFWVNRNSRTWRMVRLRTTLNKLHLTVFDTVSLAIPKFGLNFAGCIIEEVDVDVEANEIEFRVWTPSLAGTTTKYLGAYPDDVGYVIPFDSGVQYTAPANHPVFRLQGVNDRSRPAWDRLFLPYQPPFAYPSAANINGVYDLSKGWVAGPG